MNKYSDSFGKRWTHRPQFSLLSALIGQFLVCAVAQASSAELSPNDFTVAGLVAAYNFDEGSGATVTDLSIYGNTAIINGASWTSQGKFGSALNFDGISNWVTVNDSDALDLSSGMTLEAWAYPTATTGTWMTVLLKEAPPGYNLAYHLQSDPSNHPISFITTDVAGLQGVVGPQTLPLNTWTHLAATYNGATLSLYVNGTVVASQPVSGNILPSVGPLRFGGNSIWGEYFVGTIDDVRIYNRALSQTEIQADMNTPVGKCVLGPGYWKNHPQAWCMETIQIGCVTYTRAQAIAVMRHNASLDKTYSLARQLIAAKLNISCQHSSASCIASAIAAADSWLCAHPVGSNVRANSSDWQAIKTTYNRLGRYNDGELCAPSCDDDDDDAVMQ